MRVATGYLDCWMNMMTALINAGRHTNRNIQTQISGALRLTVGLMLLGFVAATTVVTEVDMSGNGPRPDGDAVLSFARWAFEGAVLLPLKFIVAFEVVVPLLLFCLTDTLPLAFGLVRAIVG